MGMSWAIFKFHRMEYNAADHMNTTFSCRFTP